MPPKDTKKEAPKAAAAAAPAKKTATPKAPHTTHLFARGFRGQRGHKLSKRTVPRRNVHNKGHASKRVCLIKEIIREVTGFAPYEKRMMEYLRNGLDKRALKLAKKRLGSHSRAVYKRNSLGDALKKQRMAAQRAAEEQAAKA